MITAQELRIGNLVINHHNEYQIITASCIVAQSQFDIAGATGYSPIPLSEEILLKLGFIKYPWFDGAYIKFNDCHLMIRIYKGEFIAFTCYVMESKQEKLHKNVKHIKKGLIGNVHQLQNYYYSNTRQELNTS